MKRLLLAAALLGFATLAEAANNGCQAVDPSSTLHTDFSCTLAAPLVPGHSLIALARQGTNSTAIAGVVDSLGNAFKLLRTVSPTTSSEGALFYALQSAVGGSDTVKVKFSVPAVHVALTVVEESAALFAPDGSVASLGSGNLCSSSILTTTKPNDVLVFGCETSSDQPGFTTTTPGFALEQANARLVLEDKAGSAVGNYAATATYPTATSNATILAAFTTVATPLILPLGANTLTVIPPCPSVACFLDITPLNLCSATLTTSCANSFQLWHTDAAGQIVVDFTIAPLPGTSYTLTSIGKDANGAMVTPAPAAFNLGLHP